MTQQLIRCYLSQVIKMSTTEHVHSVTLAGFAQEQNVVWLGKLA